MRRRWMMAALLGVGALVPAVPATAEEPLTPALETPAAVPDAARIAPPMLRPGQAGRGTVPAGGETAWDVQLRKGDRVAFEVRATGALAVEAAAAPGESGIPALRFETAAGTDGGQAGRGESTATKRAKVRVVLRAPGRDPVIYELRVPCRSGRSCSGGATQDCGPGKRPWWNVSAFRILSDPSRWEGHPVRVRAKVRMDASIRCTARACPGDGCCNACSAAMKMGPAGLRGMGMEDAGLTLDGLTCSGNECDTKDRCPYAPGSRITAWGHVTNSLGRFGLAVEGSCGPIPPAPKPRPAPARPPAP